jgi:pimeloyl-ACP methyl ester carboxylesterase
MTSPRFTSANGLRFAYIEQGEGPLVLMLHGFPDNAETYRTTLDAFAAAGYRAVAPFLRGYSPTEIPPAGTYDPLTLAHDVEGLIRALAPDGKAHVLGMDWGGTSIQAALVHCPQLIESAIVMNAAHPSTLSRFATDPAQARSVFHFWFFQTDVAEKALAATDIAMIDYLWRLWSPGYDPGDHLESVRKTLATPGVLAAALQYYGALYCSAQQRTFPLGDIDVPTLSIFGALDPTARYSHLEERYYKGPYRRMVLDDVGHWPHLERSEAFNRLALDWVASASNHSGSETTIAERGVPAQRSWDSRRPASMTNTLRDHDPGRSR